jgi:kynureninase
MTGPSGLAAARTPRLEPGEEQALVLDRQWEPHSCRDRFHIPVTAAGTPVIYFCGHSLGLQPKSASACVDQELEDWRKLGVHAHFHGRTPGTPITKYFGTAARASWGDEPGRW